MKKGKHFIKKNIYYFFCIATFFSFNPSLCHASLVQTPTLLNGKANIGKKITPADVLARIKRITAELDLIRQALGKPKERQTLLTVQNASPREVYFEARALFQQSDRLAYEVTSSSQTIPEINTKNIMATDIWELVNASLKRILIVKNELGISTKIKEQKERHATTTQILNAIIQTKQELNVLLYMRVAPSDVFEQVTLAINYTANLLEHLNIAPRIPKAPKFIPNKTPTNVYQRLLKCAHLLEKISKNSNVKMLKIKTNDPGLHHIVPSNVFDLSKIIVAKVQYLNALLPDPKIEKQYYPGYKTPSQVFQRAGILLNQLNALDNATISQPNWLNIQESLQ